MAEVRIGLEEIPCHFGDLEDPRSTINQLHPLVSVVVIAMRGVLAGANGPTSLARWARFKKPFPERVLDLPHGVPGKDVFRRVLALVEPMAFPARFARWLNSLRSAAADEAAIRQPVLAVDGKTARRSHDRSKGLGASHAVSIWAGEFGLSLGQVACAEKSNEITAIPELLRLVEIQGAIITTDAMGTRKAIAGQIIEQEADDVLALQGNQESLHDAVIEYLDVHRQNDFVDLEVRRHTTTESGHGRDATRCHFHLPVPSDRAGRDLGAGLRTIGVAISATIRNDRETIETRYYLSSPPLGVKRFAHAVRSHWGDRKRLPLDLRHDVPGRRVADPRRALAGEFRLAESVRPLPAQATSRQRQHRRQATRMRMERGLLAPSAYRNRDLVAAGPD